ncbi:MAG: ATP-binding protein [Planctomycetia bacterium]|nr:ATP-binding protein [Planctomycetia bacterium]
MFVNKTDSSAPICQVDFQGLFGQGSRVIDEILKKMADKNWSDRDIFAVNMALEESITNAIEHGNRRDPQKKVQVRYSVQNDKVFISVRDEGSGFDSRIIPDPRSKENIDKPSGRGVLLIHGFMTKVWYNQNGTELFMEKDRSEQYTDDQKAQNY